MFFSGGLWPAWNMWDSRRGDREGTINWNVACKLVIEDFALPQYSTPIFEWSENPPPLPGYGIKTRHIFVIQDKEHVLKSAVWAKLFYAILSTNTLDMGIRLGISDKAWYAETMHLQNVRLVYGKMPMSQIVSKWFKIKLTSLLKFWMSVT